MECPICLECEEERCRLYFPCKHHMCLDCFVRLAKLECPMCRFNLAKSVPSCVMRPHADIERHLSVRGYSEMSSIMLHMVRLDPTLRMVQQRDNQTDE